MRRPVSLKIMMLLALVQGLAGLLRGFNWIQIGVDLFGKGILLLPLIGTLAMMHGLFIWGVALLIICLVCSRCVAGESLGLVELSHCGRSQPVSCSECLCSGEHL